MKRIIFTICAVLICFSFSACNSGDSTPDKTPIQTPEDIKYGAEGSAYADHSVLEHIFGEWEFVKMNSPWDYTWYRRLVVNADGTCVIDSVQGKWKIEDEFTNHSTITIGLYVDGIAIYGAYFGLATNVDGETYVYLLPTAGEQGFFQIDNATFTDKYLNKN